MPSLKDALLRNWPLKLAALALAAILWVVVASEETASELVSVRLQVDVPPTLALVGPPPSVRALATGPGRELLKLYATPPVIRTAVPAAAQPPSWRFTVAPADVEVPRQVKVTIQDIEPRAIELGVDLLVRRSVPVAVRGGIETDAGFAVSGPLTVTPSEVEVSGPRGLVLALDSVPTEPVELRGVTGPFERTVPIDTSRLPVRILPLQVTVAGRVRRQ